MTGLKDWKMISKIRHAVGMKIKEADTEKCSLSLRMHNKRNEYKMK